LSTETIFALATAPGRAAVAVIRLSGPETARAVTALAGRLPAQRKASLRRLRTADGAVLDEALVLWFPGPASYTGEDSAELHLHGGVAVVEAVQDALLALGLRLAEPGEFTRRAFENGKLDLAQAEGVADLVDAQTTAQAKQALAQLGGALSQRHETWRGRLVEALAMLEANVDFPDEELPENVAARARPPLEALIADLEAASSDADRGRRVREGYRVAIIGAPNAGKSSLLNILAGRDAAIVTATPGTTRDVVEVPLEIAGYRVLLADTAGIRASEDEIEAEGVRRARRWAEEADLRLWVIDGSASDGSWAQARDLAQAGDIMARNKTDLPAGADADFAGDALALSVASGQGLAELRAVLEARVVADLAGSEFPAATRARHRALIEEALGHLRRAVAALTGSPELAAEDVRLAARALARISGVIGAEEVLGAVFGKFCIGK
jgi:tRNA modification GTPase